MDVLFVDSSYWIALLNRKDESHTRARRLVDKLRAARIVTTQMVLAEVLNFFAGVGQEGRLSAADLVDQLSENARSVIVPQTPRLFERALELYTERLDQSWSFTDCASYLIMQEHDITEALTHDHHFEQMGFKALLR